MSDPCIAEAQSAEWFPRSEWLARHQLLLSRRDQLHDTQLVFLGDSITEAWLGDGQAVWKEYFTLYKPLNLGIGGDETSHVLWRIENGELAGICPKVLVLLIGTNNIGYNEHTSQHIAEGVKLVVQKIRSRLPTTKILLLAIFPREEPPNAQFRKKVADTNAMLRPLHDGKTVCYLDLASTFLSADGSLPTVLFPDALHLSTKAYERWAKAMLPTLKNLMI